MKSFGKIAHKTYEYFQQDCKIFNKELRVQKIYVVDAFITSKPFSGNPAGVCILEERQSDDWMQAIASEMNHSETAFVLKNDAGFSIRYFTPTMEIPLCGHATLASARVLWEEGIVSRYNEITFISNGGTLQIKHQNDQIVMSFPKLEPNIIEGSSKISLKELQLNPVAIAQHKKDILFELETDKDVIHYTPNFEVLKKQPYRMIILTATHPTYDITPTSK